MRKMVVLFPLLIFLMVGCNNPVGPSDLSINPEIVYLSVGKSQVFKISGLRGSNFRVFARFYQAEPVCYSDCNPDAYGKIERVSSDTVRYTLHKSRNSEKERVVLLEIYSSTNNDFYASALIYPN